jgi:Double zinc ribbon
MAKMIRCERCGSESPADGRFCIECGAALAPAATGETTRLPGVPCPNCGSNNPEHARFCVVCGRGLAAGATPRPAPQPALLQQPPANPPAPIGAPPHSPRQHSYPRVAPAPTPIPMAPPRYTRASRHTPLGRSGVGPVLFLVGVFVLLMSGNIWPGILWLIGISSFVGAVASGRGDRALLVLIWWGGLALLFATGTIWPGILLLMFLSMAIGKRGRWSGW